jgi:hypothetical protein
MSHKTSISRASGVGIALAAVVVSFGAQSAAARPLQHHHHHHHLYAMYRGPYAPSAALPRTPEYGFLNHVPANAIRGPGYTFVPGVGILGESCDLPTSACTNEYRDTQ